VPLALEEELGRVLPVIKSLSEKVTVPISIDTYKADVVRRAVDAGASMVNDISGLRFDPEMAAVVSKRKVPVVVMHIRGNPRSMQMNPVYSDLVPEIMDYLGVSMSIGRDAGVAEDMIIIDPGIGFGKTFDHNLEIIHNLDRFASLGRPILIGPSRKAFIGKILDDAPPDKRVCGTAAAVAVSIMKGANIVRVHDVKQMTEVAKVADAIKRGSVKPSI
jgi:dihydropteroate synthase